MTTNSALYVGRVTHHRLRPRRHSLAYRTFWLLLDLDEVDALSRRLRCFSSNRFNLFSFHDTDHDGGKSERLRTGVEQRLAAAGVGHDGGPIRLLTMPRLLGYAFNPLSVYFCYQQNGSLAALLYEVHNTYGESHTYLIPSLDTQDGAVRQNCAKRFHVSPFLGMDMRYDFKVAEPDTTVQVAIHGSDTQGPIIAASLNGKRKALTDAALLRLLFTHPFMTFKVTAGIHWEALRLWLKGVNLQPKPEAPKKPDTTIPAAPIPRSSV